MAALAPTTDLTKLPLNALAAYAARCARRVQPMFRLAVDDPDSASCESAVDSAICIAEQVAAGEPADPALIAKIEEQIVHAILAATQDDSAGTTAPYAANSAYAAINCAKAILEAYDAEDPTSAAELVVSAAHTALDAAAAADPAVHDAARLDWEMLRRMQLGRYPGHGEPIDPSPSGILGPLFCGSGYDSVEQDHNNETDGAEFTTNAEPFCASELSATDFAAQTAPDEAEPAVRKTKTNASSKVRNGIESLRSQQSDLQRQLSAAQAEKQEIEAKQQAFERERASFRKEHAKLKAEMQAACESFAEMESRSLAEQEKLAEERARMDSAAELLRGEQERIEQERAELETARSRLETEEFADLSREREQLHTKQTELDAELAAVEHQRMQLQDQQALLQAERVQIEQTRNQSATATDSLKSERQKLAQLRKQLRSQQAALKANHEKLHSRAQSLKSQQQRIEEEAQSLQGQRKSDHRRPSLWARARLAHARKRLQRLHNERHTWMQERQRLLVELNELRSGQSESRSQKTSLPVASQPRVERVAQPLPGLRLLIQPGSATIDQISKLLAEVTHLCEDLDGPGLTFKVTHCKLGRTAIPNGSDAKNGERAIVEVRANTPGSGSGDWSLAQWNRFRTCLMVPLNQDRMLSEGFAAGSNAPRRDTNRRLVADAVKRANEKPVAKRADDDSDNTTRIAIDSVSQRLHRIEDMIRELSCRHESRFELTDAVADPNAAAPSSSVAESNSESGHPSLTWTTIVSVTTGTAMMTGIKFWQTVAGS